MAIKSAKKNYSLRHHYKPYVTLTSRDFFFRVRYALVTRIKTFSRLKHTVLNDSIILLCERIKEDCETNRVLNEQNELINIKKKQKTRFKRL